MRRIGLVLVCPLLMACSSISAFSDIPAPTPTSVLDSTPEEAEQWPGTVEEAIEVILAELSEEDKVLVRETPRKNLVQFHHGWGTNIRNSFGLWRGNVDLLVSCGSPDIHPDDCSMIIIERVWERLQDGE